uniref:Putative secreted protein n=1 Tax=Amblyomma americanum TaxID=6943 RepID=A0A0C9SDZ6_AMBAM
MTTYLKFARASCVAVITGLLFTSGLGIPKGGRQLESLDSSSLLCGKIPVIVNGVHHYSSCKCKSGGEYLPNGTKCLKTEKGPDDEESGRPGLCQMDECVTKKITKGCQGRDIPTVKPEDEPPFGCVYYCDTLEYTFFQDGTPCKHRVNGTYYVNGRCKGTDEKRTCNPDVPPPPAC